MQVIKWISYDESRQYEESVGWMGGTSTCLMWEEYLQYYGKNTWEYLEAIRTKILEENLKVTGAEHQDRYTPLFEDNTVGSFTYRAWGDLVAAIWNTKENQRKYNYMDFYC